MGTYMHVVLKNTGEENIKQVNSEIIVKGYEPEIYCGVTYGPFVTMEQLIEDARYMNEDPEGLKQCPHFERPIQPMYLSRNFPWLRLGGCQIKLSGGSDDLAKTAMIIAEWIRENHDRINMRESDNYRTSFVLSYLNY